MLLYKRTQYLKRQKRDLYFCGRKWIISGESMSNNGFARRSSFRCVQPADYTSKLKRKMLYEIQTWLMLTHFVQEMAPLGTTRLFHPPPPIVLRSKPDGALRKRERTTKIRSTSRFLREEDCNNVRNGCILNKILHSFLPSWKVFYILVFIFIYDSTRVINKTN